MSRRTVSVFEPNAPNIKESLDRAILCGMHAPNHHKTEPFTFKRIMSPSDATERLAEVAYHVKLRKNPDSENNQSLADRKRHKWGQIPGFLVALVEGQPLQEEFGSSSSSSSSTTAIDPYEPLPLVVPRTERQLENYAATCAAVQNVMLSLHAEGVGSKWATGPVIRTSAFRSLVKAQPDEMVVGLVMVGYPKRIPRVPVRKKSMEEIVEDL